MAWFRDCAAERWHVNFSCRRFADVGSVDHPWRCALPPFKRKDRKGSTVAKEVPFHSLGVIKETSVLALVNRLPENLRYKVLFRIGMLVH